MQQVTETRDRGAYYHINASPGHSNPASLMAKPPHTRKFDRKVPQKKPEHKPAIAPSHHRISQFLIDVLGRQRLA